MCLFVAVKSTHTYNFFNEMSKDVAGVVRINTVLTASIPAAPLNTHTHTHSHTLAAATSHFHFILFHIIFDVIFHIISHMVTRKMLSHTPQKDGKQR